MQSFENGIENDFEMTVSKIISLLKETRAAKRNVYVIGNGASATMASHLTIDFWKNLKIKAHLFSDSASLTAVGNIFVSTSASVNHSVYMEIQTIY